MSNAFRTIGLTGRLRCEETAKTIQRIIAHLQQHQYAVVIDDQIVSILANTSYPTYPTQQIGQHCDVLIVIGGDGSLLSAARAVLPHNTPLIGINRGYLGFLTDIHPQQFATELDQILAGDYTQENRFLLQTQVITQDKKTHLDSVAGLNDVVLSPGKIAHLIHFDVYIDDQLMSHNRADGLIIATPTGSTAYALSAGGPILHPQLNAIVLAPMFPHTLGSRPIVVSGDSQVRIVIDERCEAEPNLSIDGQTRIPIPQGAHIHINKHTQSIRLIHPRSYHYFATLRQKLGWESKPQLGQR